MMGRAIAIFALLALFVPINISAGSFSGKPLDFVLSDMFMLLFPVGFYFLVSRGLTGIAYCYTAAIFLYFFVCVLIILFSQSWNDGGWASVASFLRAFRPFLAFYVGYIVLRWSGFALEKWSVYIAVVFVWVIFLSDLIFNHRFPLPRWGGLFFGLDVYGFPNSPAFFYVAVLSIVVSACLSLKNYQVLFLMSAVLMSMIVIFVGSRNAIVSLLLLFFFLFLRGHIKLKYLMYFLPFVIGAAVFVSWMQVDTAILEVKASRTIDEGVFYGREDVWRDVLELVVQRPLLGYAFEPLSLNYSSHGTAHNQYIEYMYKTGFLGFLVLLVIWFFIGKSLWYASKVYSGSFLGVFYGALFCVFLVAVFSNLAQPNFTYTITQYFFVFYAGAAWSRIRRLREAENETSTSRYV